MQDIVPMALWGQDHWSTLAYVETVIVDCVGFQVGRDPRMRSNRRNFRVMAEQCPRPSRPRQAPRGVVMGPDEGTRLGDGTTLPGHDDWCCLQALAEAGLDQAPARLNGGASIPIGQDAIEPGAWIELSEAGRRVAGALRAHKASGGRFATFRPVGMVETAL